MRIVIEVTSWLKDDFDYKDTGSLVLEEAVSPGASIMDLIHLMADKYPRFGRKLLNGQKQDWLGDCLVILNGGIVSASTELNTGLKEGDTITFAPAFYGG